jgi:hypothetical protein
VQHTKSSWYCNIYRRWSTAFNFNPWRDCFSRYFMDKYQNEEFVYAGTSAVLQQLLTIWYIKEAVQKRC